MTSAGGSCFDAPEEVVPGSDTVSPPPTLEPRGDLLAGAGSANDAVPIWTSDAPALAYATASAAREDPADTDRAASCGRRASRDRPQADGRTAGPLTPPGPAPSSAAPSGLEKQTRHRVDERQAVHTRIGRTRDRGRRAGVVRRELRDQRPLRAARQPVRISEHGVGVEREGRAVPLGVVRAREVHLEPQESVCVIHPLHQLRSILPRCGRPRSRAPAPAARSAASQGSLSRRAASRPGSRARPS